MHSTFPVYFLTLCLLALRTPEVQSAKILAIFPFPSRSHFMMHDTLVRDLVARGHQITLITSLTLDPQKMGSNYTEVLIEPFYDFWDDVKAVFDNDNLYELTTLGLFDLLKMLDVIGVATTENSLKHPKVQQIINAKETVGVFDLLIAEQFYQEAFLALAYKYNIPMVTSGTMGYENFMSQMMGIISPWSFVPHGFMPFTDRMSFVERLQNSFYSLYEDLYRRFLYFPKMDKLVEKYFSHLPVKIPPVTEIEKNISLMLLNSYAPLTTPRPTSNAMIPVGGMHIYPPKPLPADMQTFLDEAEHGAIYFSLGSNVQSKDMPLDKLKMFLEVFAGLKQRVLWKFEDQSLTEKPSNVMIKKWLPQSDVLAHPNIKVFITHGGLLGTEEGVHYAVPMLGMPVYCDQHLNMNKAVQGGYAISLHFQDITKEILKNTLQQLLENPAYKQRAQHVSEIFRDRPLSARDTAIYWIEYVIRHKGAPHMRSAGLDLKWYQFYLLDVIAFVVAVLLLAVLLLSVSVRAILGCCRQNKVKLH